MAWSKHTGRPPLPSDWKRRRRAVLKRDGGRCYRCGHDGADQVDHIINRAAGGTHDLHNLAAIHGGQCLVCGKRCHTEKSVAESHVNRPQRRREPERHPGLL